MLNARTGPNQVLSAFFKKNPKEEYPNAAPVTIYEAKPTIIKDSDVFRDGKVSTSLSYRRTTYPQRFTGLKGVLMDEERVMLWSVSTVLHFSG